MKLQSLISKVLIVAICAVMLLTAMSTNVCAATGESSSDPYVVSTMPYSSTPNFYKVDTGRDEEYSYENSATGEIVTGTRRVYDYHYTYYYRYVAQQDGRVTIKLSAGSTYCQITAAVNGSEVGYLYSNGTKSMYVDVKKGQALSVVFSTGEDTNSATMEMSIAAYPEGSQYRPYETSVEELASGISVELDQNECIYYTFTVPKDGVLRFYTNDVKEENNKSTHSLPAMQQIVFNGNTSSIFAYAMSDYMMIVSTGDEITMALECPGYAVGGSYTLRVQYTDPIFLDNETKYKLFNGMYVVEATSSEDGSTYCMYGVRFKWGKKTVSVSDVKNCIPLGTYNFTYNDANGALVLEDSNGNLAPYGLIVVKDAFSELGVGLKLVYSGSYLLKQCDVAPEPSDVVARALTGHYEDIYKGKFYEALTFDYEAGTVVIADDWQSEGVVYTMGEFDVFSSEMVITSESGKQITIGVRNGQVIYYNNPLTPVEEVHVHEYTTAVTAPTCTVDGYTIYTCQCGETYMGDTVTASGHSYVDEVTAPTCTADGYTTHTCSICQDTYQDGQTAATGHSYGAWAENGEDHKKVCSVCNDEQTGQHTWGAGVTVKEPTELDDGESLLTCADCGATKTQLIPSLGHSHHYTAVTTAPTCTADGYTTFTCKCGDSYTEAGDKAPGHSYVDKVTAPTCTAGGYTTHTCSVCNDTYQDSKVVAKGHTYSKKVTVPTCTETGYTTYSCADCGHSYQDNKTDATGHSYDEGKKEDNRITYTCATCGDQYSVEVSTNAFTVPGALTGTLNGSQEYAWVATEDGYLVIDNISALTGAYVSVTINGADAYPTEHGYPVTEGDSVVITVMTYSQLDINIPVYMNQNQADKLEDGAMEFDVTFSGWDLYEQPWKAPFTGVVTFVITESNVQPSDLTFRVINANGQFYNQYEFGLEVNGHQFVTLNVTKGDVLTIVAYEDTMQVDGKLHISVQEGKPELHTHTYDEGVVTEPTCTENGYTTYTCTVCSDSYTDNRVEGGHAYEGVATDPTCTEGGYTTYTCSVCNSSYVESGDKALYHSYGDWEVVKEATTTESGSRKHTCIRCGAEESEEIPVIEQVPTTAPVTQPATTASATQPATTGGDNVGGNDGGSTVMTIVLVAVVVLIGGGIVAVVVIKKKK